MIEDWYEEASVSLLESLNKLEGKGVPGIDFLTGFFIGCELNSLSDYSDEEEADLHAKECIDGFEGWLSDFKSESFSLGKRHIWYLSSQNESSNVKTIKKSLDYSFDLNDKEKGIVSKNIADLQADDHISLDDLYAKALGSNDRKLIADLSLRVAIVSEKLELGYQESAEKWALCGDGEKANDVTGAYKRYVKAGFICGSNLDHKLSADYFLKAIESYPESIDDLDNYINLIRRARRQYELAGEDSEASKLYIKECDEQRRHLLWYRGLTLGLYKSVSNYGESPIRVLYISIGIILVWALIYAYFGIHPSTEYLTSLGNPVTSVSMSTVGLDSVRVGLYYSVVTFTTLGYGDFSPVGNIVRMFSALQAVFGLLLTSLFMITVVRKYSR